MFLLHFISTASACAFGFTEFHSLQLQLTEQLLHRQTLEFTLEHTSLILPTDYSKSSLLLTI